MPDIAENKNPTCPHSSMYLSSYGLSGLNSGVAHLELLGVGVVASSPSSIIVASSSSEY